MSYIETSNLDPGDVFVDAQGNIWVVKHWCAKPTVTMRMVWSAEYQCSMDREQGGAVSGLMWEGFRKLAKREPEQKPKAAAGLRPLNCRMRALDEGRPYRTGGCEACLNDAVMGCPHDAGA